MAYLSVVCRALESFLSIFLRGEVAQNVPGHALTIQDLNTRDCVGFQKELQNTKTSSDSTTSTSANCALELSVRQQRLQLIWHLTITMTCSFLACTREFFFSGSKMILTIQRHKKS